MKQSNYEKVKERLQGITEGAEEYASSEDSPLAEFVGSFFYGDADSSQIDLSRLGEETASAVKRLLKKDRKVWQDALSKHCELIHVPDVWYRDSEILSATIGEQEHQLDSGPVIDEINALSPEDFENIKREFLGSSSKQGQDIYWFYTSHDYERFALILDEESFLEEFGTDEERKAVSNE